LLDEIVGVAAGQEVGGGLQAHETVVAPDEPVVRVAIAELCEGDQISVIDLRFRVRVIGDSCHEQILSCGQPSNGQAPTRSLARPSPGAVAMSPQRFITLSFSVMWARASHSYGELSRAPPRLCKIS